MKKLMFLLAFVGMSGATIAQTVEMPTDKYSVSTNGFWNNWFVTAGASYNAFYSSQEDGLSLSPFESFRRSWGAELTVGKWFTPGFGMRLKGAGVWYTQVNGVDVVANCPTVKDWEASIQAMFNLNNLFCGYKYRLWNISPYIGVGVAHRMAHRASYSPLLQFGLSNQFNVTKRFFVNLDIYGQVADEVLDGVNNRVSDKFFGSRDCRLGASLSLGLNLGKTGWEKTPDLEAIAALHAAQLAALNDQLAEQEAENVRLKAMLAKPQHKEEVVKTVKEVNTTPVSVFFNLNSSRIACKKDLVSVDALVQQAKVLGKKILVVGYADSKTGSASYNQTLSQKRAEAVASEIVEMGIARENVEVLAEGGVNTLTPYSYNRRVIVYLK